MHQNDPKKFYELVMDSKLNPLSRIPDLNVRHMVMQLLAEAAGSIVERPPRSSSKTKRKKEHKY